MSLTDALLLEGHRDPREVWIALRTDGQRGSGTQSDPFDGSSVSYPAIPITQITLTKDTPPDPYEATAITDGPHGFHEGEMVSVAGGEIIATSNNNFTLANANYHGTFRIKSVSPTSFTYQMLARPYDNTGQASALNPLSCWRERERFDVIMRSLSPNTAIHLGPGVFETKGFAGNNIVAGRWTLDSQGNHVVLPGSWVAQSGQRILGSGMAITTLKVVGGTARNAQYAAIGAALNAMEKGYLDGFEASDFTVDCNAERQPSPHVACIAIALQSGGRHVRIRRVRAIRFGSRAPDFYVENFVFFIGAPYSDIPNSPEIPEQRIARQKDSHNCVFEDCIAEERAPNPVWNSAIILVGGGEYWIYAYFTRGCAIRNCFVNGQITYGTRVPLPIDTIIYDEPSGTVTVTTKAPHLLTGPGNVVLRGVTVDGDPNNLFNGVFELDAVDSPIQFKYKVTTTGTPDNPNNPGLVGGGVSTHAVAIEEIEEIDADSEWTFRITTRDPHLRTELNNVKVSGVLKADGTSSDAFNGVFAISNYDPSKPRELIYTLSQPPDESDPVEAYAFAGIGHIALTGDGGTMAVVEGNCVVHCSTAVFHDTFSTKDLVVRDNYFHDVLAGPFQNLNLVNTWGPTTLSIDRDNTTAIATTSSPHGFHVGDRVSIFPGPNDSSFYRGLTTPPPPPVIKDVPNATTFKYDMDGVPAGPTTAASFGTYETPSGVTIASQHPLHSLERVKIGSQYFARAKTAPSTGHGLALGDAIRVTFAGNFVNGAFEKGSKFNGGYRVTKIVDHETFEYEVVDENGNPVDPGIVGSPFSAGYFGRIWQTRRLEIENNVIDVGIRTLVGGDAYGHAAAIPLYGTNLYLPQYSLPRSVVRGNVISNVDDRVAPSNRAIEVGGCGRLIVEKNIISVDRTNSIEHNGCGQIHSLNNLNLTTAGTVLESVSRDLIPMPNAFELKNKIEEAMVLSFL